MPFTLISLIGIPLLLVIFVCIFITKQYRRCSSNQVLVIFGKVSGGKSARCIHGGGTLIIPLLQDYTYMSLEPITISINLEGALSKKNIRVTVPSTFTVGISTQQEIMHNAAERLLGLGEAEISHQASDIILGQLRQVIASMTIEEINTDRDKFIREVTTNVDLELNKIGLSVINVNLINITDESGYIEAIGKKAAAEAINQATIDVAEQEKIGQIGVAAAKREREVSVAEQLAQSAVGQKEAEKNQRTQTAALEAQAIVGQKEAEKMHRTRAAILDAEIKQAENESQALIVATDAALSEKKAEAQRRSDVAKANAEREIFESQKSKEVARLQMQEMAKQEVEKLRTELEAEAQAEKTRRLARGEADAILSKFEAEAQGIQKILEAKALGYKRLVESCSGDTQSAATLLLIEKMAEIITIQVEAIKNIKIDKITVWDSGSNGNEKSTLSNFIKDYATMSAPLHEIAEQAGIKLPAFLGEINKM